MKFMKLGSRPDTFYTTESVRSVSSEVSNDIVIEVKGSRYLLHKFPLLSKCLHLQKLLSENSVASQLELPDFPGGVEAFETCAKFCYGITITLSAYNIVSIRCAAEYLQMTEDVEKGNLVNKLEAFFDSCILNGWKDTIITLQSTKAFPFSSEDFRITSRCIEALASKVLAHPSKTNLSQSKGWWAQDLVELRIDFYWRTMIAIKSGSKVPADIFGDALRIYASRWLQSMSKYVNIDKQSVSDYEKAISRNKLVLESIISLLPGEKGAVSCSFLLKLLKAANILKTSSSSKMELARRVGLQLEEASVSDMLIPSSVSESDVTYDIDVVMTMLEEFKLKGQNPNTSPSRTKQDFERRRSKSADNVDSMLQESRRSSSASHSSKIKVAKLVDGYLQEIAKEKNLPLSKFISFAETIPEFSRLDHDGLYKAIDIYLKEHPELNKSERKRLCRVLDCKKLSVETCMHAAQNEMLPLRVVVQVLFFEQARVATASGLLTELPSNIKALLEANKNQSKSKVPISMNGSVAPEDRLSVSSLKMKIAEKDDNLDESFIKSSKIKSCGIMHYRPKRMLSKLWPISRTTSEKS